MNDVEYCVKNMRLKTIIAVFDTKAEAREEAVYLNECHQTNEYWVVKWKATVQHD